MIIILLFLLWCIPILSLENKQIEPWTVFHSKLFSPRERVAHENKLILLFSKENVKNFTQLVFSWNAFRPVTGYFSFYVQVRNARTKKWGIWHHMIDWGAGIQRSYSSKSDGFSSYVHVRLEIEKEMESDAFRVKAEARDGATFTKTYGFFVALSHFELFKTKHHENDISKLPSVFIRNVPLIAQYAVDHQDNTRICSPVSCTMVTSYITGRVGDPLDFAMRSFDNGLSAYGSWPFNSAHAFEQCKGKVYFFVRRFNSFKELHAQLQSGIPVIVSVRGTLAGAYKSFPHGHLLVVVGWDNSTGDVLCHDPAANTSDQVFKRYKIEHFLPAWERSHCLAYVAKA